MNKDRFAAEYLLLALISRTQRRDGSMIIGNLNVNLSGLNSEQAAMICDFV